MPGSAKSGPQLSGSYSLITDETSDATTFAVAPQEVVLVATLEIPIRDSHGEYLLVISPRYDTFDETGPVETTHWAPPYVARVIKAPPVGWKNVGQVKKQIRIATTTGIDGWTPRVALIDMISTWACGLYEVELTEAVTEYKRSWNTPGVMKIYHIMRFRVSDEADTCVRRALADPDSRKGFAFLPLDDTRYDTAIHERHCARHGGREFVFIGKPLLSNLAHVVGSRPTRAWLRDNAFDIARQDFYADHDGLLVCGDIANYGRACQYAQGQMHGMKIDDEESDVVLRDLATVAITRIFHDAGLSQVHTAGDGFIAAIPVASGDEALASFKRFLDAYHMFTEQLDRISERLASHFAASSATAPEPPSLGSRLAVHYGSYRYGKMAQAASLVTSFDGAAVIDVARHEQGLRGITKDESRAAAAGLTDDGHVVVFSEAATDALGTASQAGVDVIGVTKKVPIESKEASEQAFVRMLYVGGDLGPTLPAA